MGRRAALTVLATVTAVGLLGCGGSRATTPTGGHTIVYVPPGPKGIYVTFVLPVTVSANKLRNKGFKVVARAKGPQDCSITKTIQGGRGRKAHLNGKTLTVKVNGSNPATQSRCEVFATERIVPASIGK